MPSFLLFSGIALQVLLGKPYLVVNVIPHVSLLVAIIMVHCFMIVLPLQAIVL